MSRLPVIVGFGGYNSAGRSSFHHGFRRTVIESLDPQTRQETLAGLAVMMKRVSVVDGKYRDGDGTLLSLAELERRHGEQILASTLIRRIEKQHFDVDAAHWHKSLTLSDEGQPLHFTTGAKQLPEPLPASWSVESLEGNQVRVTIRGSCEFKVDSYRELPVKSAGQLPTGFEPGELYNSRFHPRGLQLSVVAATDAAWRGVRLDRQVIYELHVGTFTPDGTLDAAVAAFHRRPLQNQYKVLMLDGVVLARKTGAGALRRPVLVALGLRPDGKKEVIDFRLAASESAAEWEKFLADLYRRGLTGEGLDMICVDGGSGLLAALPEILHGIPVQRCWAHKIRNVLDKVKKADQPAVKRTLHKIMNASNAPAARAAARKFANRFEDKYPAAVACLRNDLDELLTCFRYKSEDQRRKVRTTNAIERRFREVRRRTRPMGTFQDRTSMDRILFAVFTHENKSQGVSTPFLLTQNN